jgi:hypothetical protein
MCGRAVVGASERNKKIEPHACLEKEKKKKGW